MNRKPKRTVAQRAADKLRPGRPTVDNPRCERITIRFTPEEVNQIKARAKADGVTVATYLINCIFGGK